MGRVLGLLAAVGMLAFGTAHARTASEGSTLEAQAQNKIEMMTTRDPGLRPLLNQAAAYIVFPNVVEGGLVVGAAGGRGVVFEKGRPAGFAELTQASVGAVAGGQKFAELVLVRDASTLAKLRAGTFDVGAKASAVMVHSGAARQTEFGDNGLAIFDQPEKGAMLNLSLSGQRIRIIG